MNPQLHEGFARAKALTRQHAKTFSFSSIVLGGERRNAAFALYAFCRRLDDLVDGDNQGNGQVQATSVSPADLSTRLQQARDSVSAVYQGRDLLAAELPWHPAEFCAFRHTVERFQIPEAPFQELINGMEMDLTKTRYANFEELRLYCHRVAGVVGLMMTHVLGFRDEACLPFAADLGIAMQLTNILRDVREDFARGRVYLPADELSHFGLTDADLASHCGDARWVEFMQFQIERARTFYSRSMLGVPFLQGVRSRRLVRLMRALYSHILDTIEQQSYDVFSQRAHVPFGRKLRLAAGVLVTPDSRALGEAKPVPRLASGAR